MIRTQRVYRHGSWVPVAFTDLKGGDIARFYEPTGECVPCPGAGGDGYSFRILALVGPNSVQGEPADPTQKGTT